MTASTSVALWEKLLVCVDGSPESEGARRAALDLARTSGSKVYLLEVLTYIPGYELQSPDLLPPPPVNLEMMAAQEAAVRELLETRRAEAAAMGVDLEPRLHTSSSAYEGILEEAQDIQPNVIVMGRHGFTGLTRLLMGSVTARVIGHSPFNVLVVPKDAPLDFSKILVAGDGSPYSAVAWEEALMIAQRMGSRLMGVSVARNDGAIKRCQEVMARMEADARQRGVALEPFVMEGQPFEAIIKVARTQHATLIILGSHGRTGLARLLMGSVAERVIGQAPCPALVVKKK